MEHYGRFGDEEGDGSMKWIARKWMGAAKTGRRDETAARETVTGAEVPQEPQCCPPQAVTPPQAARP